MQTRSVKKAEQNKKTPVICKCGNEVRYVSIFYDDPTTCHACRRARQDKEQINYEENIKLNVIKIYGEYKNKKEPRYLSQRRILNDEQFNLLYNYLSNHTGERDARIWCDALLGIYNADDYPHELKRVGVMLTTPQALTLIGLYIDDDFLRKGNHTYTFSHAIGCNALLVHELVKKDGILRYYCGRKDEESITKWWSDISFLWNTGSKCIIGECVICFDNISLADREKNCMCSHCGNSTHIECKLKHMWAKGRAECEHCRGMYNDVSDLYWDSHQFIQVSQDKMIPLTWKDVFNKVVSF
jgi:hypothetical protein